VRSEQEVCNLCGSFVIHHHQINWTLQQNSYASVPLSWVQPDGLLPNLMLTRNLRAPGPVNHPENFM
jgi:hypothetical protein